MNLTNYLVTAPHIAFEQVKMEAAKRQVEINGSEVVGLIPLQALLLAAEYYAWKEHLPRATTEHEALELVHERMGLSSFRAFDAEKKIIEYATAN
jgi:glutamate formiminotransferase / formiminotetrahydrofolate cyclodeaminase